MKIRFGYELLYECQQPTPMILLLSAQPNAAQRLLIADTLHSEPRLPLNQYRDLYGNLCVRLHAPRGLLRMTADAVFEDSGVPEPEFPAAREYAIDELPAAVLAYLLPSRYCESDLMFDQAQELFGQLAPGWARVQAICDFVHRHVEFGYPYARSTKTALETYRERRGVCRDLAHLAITFCRCMNIPARYTTSYLGDIGVAAVEAPMDFAGAMEVFLGGAWHAFDPRNHARRIGRLTIARGRDAADVAISTAFGTPTLKSFRVWTDQISEQQAAKLAAERSGAGRPGTNCLLAAAAHAV